MQLGHLSLPWAGPVGWRRPEPAVYNPNGGKCATRKSAPRGQGVGTMALPNGLSGYRQPTERRSPMKIATSLIAAGFVAASATLAFAQAGGGTGGGAGSDVSVPRQNMQRPTPNSPPANRRGDDMA